jgi:hypothetical protein
VATTTRLPHGLTTTAKNTTLGETTLPDPTKSHQYWEDFDYFVVANWATSGTIAQVDEDGGILGFTIATGPTSASSILKDGNSFSVEPNKRLWLKSRFKRTLISTGYRVGLVTDAADTDDGMFFTNIGDSDALGLIDPAVWVAGAGTTLAGSAGVEVTLQNSGAASASATTTFTTVVGAAYTVVIDFKFTNTAATFSARDPSDNELGTVTTGLGDEDELFTFTAVSTTTTLKWVNVDTTSSDISKIVSVVTISDHDSLVIANSGTRTILELGVLSAADTYGDFGFYYDGTKVHAYFNDVPITSGSDDNIPEGVALTPLMRFLQGADAGAQTAAVDYFYASKSR